MNINMKIRLFKTFHDNDLNTFRLIFSSLSFKEKKEFFQKPFKYNNKKQILLYHYIEHIENNEDFLEKVDLNFLKIIFKFPVNKKNNELQKKLFIFNNTLMRKFSLNSPHENIVFRSFVYLNDYIQQFGNIRKQERMDSMFAFLLNKDNFLHVIKNYNIYEPYLVHNWTPNFVYDFLDHSRLYNHKEIDFIFNNYPPLKNMNNKEMEFKIGWVKVHPNISYILKLHSEYNKYDMLKQYNPIDFPNIASLLETEMLLKKIKEEKNILENALIKENSLDMRIQKKRL